MKSSLIDQLGAALGPAYTIERELEGGGMARVFVAFDDTLQRRVAVKVLPEHMAAAVSVDRFRREILLSAGLQHPHIVGVLSAGVADGLPYFVMPYVDGESLGTRLHTRGRLTVPQAVSIMKDVARALAYAHERGVVHRDIKPQNILLAGGAATVTDFGVAKALSSAQRSGEGRSATLTDAGTSLGTPLYMAPEQAAADPDVDHRADIYAFGVTAYEMLVGDPPFAGLPPRALMAARMTEDPPHVCSIRPDVPQVLADLVMRCVERDPADRPQTAHEILTALDDPAMVSGAFGSATGVRARWRRTHRWWIVAAILLVVAGLGAAFTVRSRRSVDVRAASAGVAAAPAAPSVARVVVLPLVSIGGDSANAYLAEGITNELASALSRVPGVQVVSPSRAAALLTAGRSPSDVGRELGVTRQLEGTVQREGTRLRVTARLVDVRDGTMTWSDMYERDVTDLLSVQDELTRVITGAVREAIGAQIQPSDTAAPAPTSLASSSSAAYDLYLRGRFQLNKRGSAPLRQAIAYFKQAIAKDRDLAPAYSGLAAAQGLLPLHTNVSAARSLADGLRNADRAIALDSSLAEAWAARGVLHSRSWRWADAERDFRRAIAIDPTSAAAHQWLGELLMVRGRLPEAVASLQRAAQLDAGSPVTVGTLGVALALAGRTEEALATAERAVSYDSTQLITRIMLGGVRLYARRPAEAVAPLETATHMDPSSTTALGLLGYTFAVMGDADAAHRMSVRLEALPAGPGRDVATGRIALGLGDTAEAVARLERAARTKDPFFATESARSPIFAPLLQNARYQALLRSIGL
ncbi:MAG TPA: protein kinase [Gemmatimonadaceae bacterium]|nr:protein kinase [Gemmatimonadaceae bacterium]